MKGNMLRLFEAVNRGIPLPFRGIENKRSMVYSGNVAEAVRCCLRAQSATAQVFFVSDGIDLSTPQLLREIGAALGKKPRVFGLPRMLLEGAGRIGDTLGRPGRPFAVNTEVLQRLFGSLTVDISKLKRVTGYVPQYSPAEGIRKTALWYRGRETAPGSETGHT
jgi:UDP-glucose 4-epimerase